MSENSLNLKENEMHYVCEDQEYVLDEAEVDPELRDLICNAGAQAILVNGQYLVTDTQAILLQEGNSNLTQFYINDNSETFIVDTEENSSNNLFEAVECIQLVEEESSEPPQIIYYTNDDLTTEELSSEQEDVTRIHDDEGNIYPFKRIKLEGQVLNFDEFVQKQGFVGGEGANKDENEDESSSFEFRIVDAEGNELHAPEESTNECSEEKVETEVDLSKITGRNLITGQTVTLHSYMEKLKKRLSKSTNTQSRKLHNNRKIGNDKVNKKPELSHLLDKTISIGKTKSGKKIVGKIIHVEKKNTSQSKPEPEAKTVGEKETVKEKNQVVVESESETDNEIEEEGTKTEDQTKILVNKSSISTESFEQISKTLGGVMEMDSVRKKLENKNIVVKLVEKKYVAESDSYVKNTSYSYGYMEKEAGQGGEDKWKFVPDQDTRDEVLGGLLSEEEEKEKTSTKFPITISLTILISLERGGIKSIRVNLNPAPGNFCTACAQYFSSSFHLRRHLLQVHRSRAAACELCERTFADSEKLREHRNVHVQEGRLFVCSDCNKCFPSQAKLQRHAAAHDVFFRSLECEVCEVRCSSEWALKKHLLTHTGIKPFACDVCKKQFMTQYDANFHRKIHFPDRHFACSVCLRTFSRHSNLLRHAEIHKGTGALYKCEICYCSYNYISSLTRHMVQNHVLTNS